MTVFDLVRLIVDNSFMAVCAAVIIWIFIKNEINRNRKEKLEEEKKIKDEEAIREERKREDEIRDKQYNAVLEKLFEKFDGCVNKQSGTHSVEEDAFQEKVNHSIDDVLRTLRESTNASRAILIRYHNGMYDLVGNSTIKMSITNEKTALGLAPDLPNFQNQFRSLFGHWCSIIREKGFYYLEDIETLKDIGENTMYSFFKSKGTKSVFGRAVYDSEQNVVGFVVVEYNSDYKEYDVTLERIIDCLRDKANKISALLILTNK